VNLREIVVERERVTTVTTEGEGVRHFKGHEMDCKEGTIFVIETVLSK
jgi:hypothetical protein